MLRKTLGPVMAISALCVSESPVTSYLAARTDQIRCRRYCKLGRQTPYSRHHQPWESPCYKSPNEHG